MPEYQLREEDQSVLGDYARIPISFSVNKRVDSNQADVGKDLVPVSVPAPYLKDYDVEPGNSPTDWSQRFDLSSWGFVTAWLDQQRVGGVAVAHGCPDVGMLEGRTDLAVIWDLRVLPEFRASGVGSLLCRAAEAWARSRDCSEIKVETQDINYPACRLYRSAGFTLSEINPGAYVNLPDEVQLIWRKAL